MIELKVYTNERVTLDDVERRRAERETGKRVDVMIERISERVRRESIQDYIRANHALRDALIAARERYLYQQELERQRGPSIVYLADR